MTTSRIFMRDEHVTDCCVDVVYYSHNQKIYYTHYEPDWAFEGRKILYRVRVKLRRKLGEIANAKA